MIRTLVLFLFLGHSILNGFTGEIVIKFKDGTTTGTFSLNVTSSDYSWHWENNSIIRDNNTYSRLINNASRYDFDAPKSVDNGDAAISWGLMNFNISTNTGLTKSFNLDLRDENWSTAYTKHDTYILINNDNDSILLSRNDGINPPSYVIITNNQTYNIWEFWGRSSALTENFRIPVKLVNRVENTDVHFGYLLANSRQIGTDSYEDIRINGGQVMHGSLDTSYFGRKYSFKWIHQQATPLSSESPYAETTIFNSQNIISSARQVTRIFKQVYPLTIKNNIGEIGTSSYGTISFKDPTKTNLFSSVSVSGNGYINNEAFEQLYENIPGYGLSKYSVKAISPIT